MPAAFAGVLVLRWLGDGESVQQLVKVSLGIALFVAAGSLIGKAYVQLVERARRRARGIRSKETAARPDVVVRPALTVLVGVVGGLIVGMTSVGSGSLIIIALLALYPALQASQLVGTDLVQAVPLVASAAVAHLLFGDFHFDVTASSSSAACPVSTSAHSCRHGRQAARPPGVSPRAPGLRPQLVGASNLVTVIVLGIIVFAGPPLWAWARVRHGMPPLATQEAVLARAGNHKFHRPVPKLRQSPRAADADVGTHGSRSTVPANDS